MPEAVPIAVKSATGFATAAGVWTGVIGLLLLVVLGIVKIAPKWRELGIAEKNTDLTGLRAEMAEVKSQLQEAMSGVMSLERKMTFLDAAHTLVVGEMMRIDPENAVLKQARDLMAKASMGDMGVVDGFARISRLAGEKR